MVPVMIATFFCSVAGGMLFVLGISRMDLIAKGFIRLIGVIALAASAGISVWWVMGETVTHAAPGGEQLRIGAAACSLACSGAAAWVVLFAHSAAAGVRVLRMVAVTGGGCGVAAACLWGLDSTGLAASWGMTVTHVAGQVSGALLIGSVTVAWLVGHAYLTAAKMTITPLVRLSRLFSLFVGLRFGYLIACLLLIKYGAIAGEADLAFSRLAGSWLILCLRVGVGLIAVGMFAYMVGDCVKVRSTQSATGILYFASIFSYIGELSSQHLANDFGLPL